MAARDLASLVTWINAQHGTTFLVGERFAHGEQGAVALADADGTPYVLKWTAGAHDLGRTRDIMALVDRLRAHGYPAPEHVAVGLHPHGRYVVQTALPGTPVGRLTLPLLDQLASLNDLQAGAGAPPAVGATGQDGRWLEEIAALTLHGGPGYCLLAPMRGHAQATARLLDILQAVAASHRDVVTPVGDIVHVDFNPYNVLRQGDRISGVVDWDGACVGDRAFDLATMLFYSYDQADIRDALWRRILPITAPAAAAIYLAHMIHRQVDWSIRHHNRATIDRWLRQAGLVLRDIPLRTGCSVPVLTHERRSGIRSVSSPRA